MNVNVDMAVTHLCLIFVILVLSTFGVVDMTSTDDRLIVQFDHSLSTDPSDHEHLYNYCNNHTSTQGDEGLIHHGYSLQQVHIVLTPGLTNVASKIKVQGHTPPRSLFCDPPALNSSSVELNSLRTRLDLYKAINHNAHFSQLHPAFTPHDSHCQNNRLTSVGFQQMISIGKHLQHHYLNHHMHKKLKGHYSSIHVSSVPSRSSYQSLLGFLNGFLNEKQLYKTKIHEARGDFCGFKELNLTTCNCAKIREFSPFAFRSSAKGAFLFKDSFPDKIKISKLMTLDGSDKVTGLELFQLLMQYKCSDSLKHLCPFHRICNLLDDAKLSALHRMLGRSLLSLFTDSNFRTHSELRVYPFLEQLMIKASLEDPQKPVNIYMGDKHFMQYLLTALDIFQHQVMPLASRLVFELFRKNWGHVEGGGRLYLRVLYNGEDVTHKMSVCSHGIENGLCSLDNFSILVKALREQYAESCPAS